ncbi:hypothetical protein [Azospirillum sp.]|uniref:hypothetical protein n=1 Tax=Azospirillum sp. TaxID=34012 RepID=UPI00262F3C25|nr:hypothetical protein [Azospirillum sp.]
MAADNPGAVQLWLLPDDSNARAKIISIAIFRYLSDHVGPTLIEQGTGKWEARNILYLIFYVLDTFKSLE